jgi:pimeloyl-ACP methyl ester carboxylesterase
VNSVQSAREAWSTQFTEARSTESPHWFGGGLFGIATQPAGASSRTGVLFLNSASDPRAGPHRLYVRAARNLAACGVPSLRFDPTGAGDSLRPLPEGPTHAYSAQRLEDTRAALDFAQERLGVERLALVGLCSGAYVAFHAGIEDPRVVSQILINLQTFRWREGDTLDVALRNSVKSSDYYGRRALRRDTWRRFFRGELHALAVLSALVRRRLILRSGARRALARSLASGRRALFVFAEEDGGRDVYGAEIGEKKHPLLQLEIVPGADHTFSAGWAQRWLLERIEREVLGLAPYDMLSQWPAESTRVSSSA